MRGERTYGKVGRCEPSREDSGSAGRIPERTRGRECSSAAPKHLSTSPRSTFWAKPIHRLPDRFPDLKITDRFQIADRLQIPRFPDWQIKIEDFPIPVFRLRQFSISSTRGPQSLRARGPRTGLGGPRRRDRRQARFDDRDPQRPERPSARLLTTPGAACSAGDTRSRD